MRTHSFLAIAFAAGLTAAQDLATVLSGQDSLSSLLDLLGQYPDVTEFLASQQDVTLFAPNNDAIAAITESGGLEGVDVEQVLRYHLYQGVVASSDIRDVPQFLPSYFAADNLVSNGQVASVSRDPLGNAIVTTGLKSVSKVVVADTTFENGIVHIVDSVLSIPSSVSETLVAGGITALAGATTELDLVSTLEGLGDVTIFAPNNDAFRAIAGAAGGLSSAQLTEILQYHVISGTVVYSTLLEDGASVPTLQGTTVDISVDQGGAVFVDGARVINSDILIANGVLHVIDAVLNPDEEAPQPDTPGFPTGDSDTVPFTSGVQAPSSVNSAFGGTTNQVAAILVTAAPEPTVYLLPNLSLSTDVAGTAPTTGVAPASGAVCASSTSSTAAATGQATSSGASASTLASSASSSDSSSTASASPEQQTENAGTRDGWPAAAVAIVAMAAFVVGL